MRVRKRDGGEEEFIREKIVIAIVNAGGKLDLARTVAQEVETAMSRNSMVTTEQINIEVLNKLKSKDTRTFNRWVQYIMQTQKTPKDIDVRVRYEYMQIKNRFKVIFTIWLLALIASATLLVAGFFANSYILKIWASLLAIILLIKIAFDVGNNMKKEYARVENLNKHHPH
jgi:hypothetical protein